MPPQRSAAIFLANEAQARIKGNSFNPPVPPAKAHKVDINSSYPCPCRRQGQLVPITLTEAFGCQRCQQIFVLKQDGHSIEQLSTTYPYKRTWYWNGHQWQPTRHGLGENYWYFTLGLSFFFLLPLLLWLPLVLQVSLTPEVIFWIVATLLLAVVPAVVAWLALYRR